MTILPRTLAAMQFRPTAYEVVAKQTGEDDVVLAFTERRTKGGLLSVAQQNGTLILKLIGTFDEEVFYTKRDGWAFGPVRVCFSGRTERDCATH